MSDVINATDLLILLRSEILQGDFCNPLSFQGLIDMYPENEFDFLVAGLQSGLFERATMRTFVCSFISRRAEFESILSATVIQWYTRCYESGLGHNELIALERKRLTLMQRHTALVTMRFTISGDKKVIYDASRH